MSALGSVSRLIPSALMAPANARGTRQSAKLRRLRQRDDREVSLAAIAPPRPCHSMAWSGGISLIYNINLLPLTNEHSRSSSTDYALGVAHNTSHILRLLPRSLRLHIGMCSRRSSNGLILPAYARFHPSYCWKKIAPPVPSCNSPFHIHSQLLCHEHYLSVPRACRDDFQQLLPSRMD